MGRGSRRSATCWRISQPPTGRRGAGRDGAVELRARIAKWPQRVEVRARRVGEADDRRKALRVAPGNAGSLRKPGVLAGHVFQKMLSSSSCIGMARAARVEWPADDVAGDQTPAACDDEVSAVVD